MPLPILESRYQPTPADLLRLFHRTDAHWVEHLSPGVELSVGTAYANAEFSRVWDANNIRNVALHENTTPQQAIEEVEAHYATQNSRCAYWVMNPSATPDQTQPMIDHLLSQGYRRQADDILYLHKMPRLAPHAAENLQIIPARASYKFTEELAREKATERWGGLDQLVAAHMQHLDDPHFDAILAISDNKPVGFLGVLAVGELGRIEDVYVSKDFRSQGIGSALMDRAIEICARSLFKHVFICVEPTNQPAQRLYTEFGFEKIGEFVSYGKRD